MVATRRFNTTVTVATHLEAGFPISTGQGEPQHNTTPELYVPNQLHQQKKRNFVNNLRFEIV
jgi:hypothetical protein